MALDDSFSSRELYRALAIEATRANFSFLQSQLAAQQAARTNIESIEDGISTSALEISQIQFEFALIIARPHWLILAWRSVISWLGVNKSVNSAPRFRFAPVVSGSSLIIRCTLERNSMGRYRISDEGKNGAGKT